MGEQFDKKANRWWGWAASLCAVQVLSICLVSWPYWSEALRGRSFYATALSMCIYGFTLWVNGLLFLCSVGLLRQAVRSAAATIPIILCFKWIWIMIFDGLDYFHNRMGLGMEILGPVPNMVIDAIILAGSLVVLWAVTKPFGVTQKRFQNDS